MKIRIALFILSVAALAAFGLCTQASAYDGYLAYQLSQGWNNPGIILQNQRNTEAIINEMRAQRHQPPCSIGLLGQWQGRPRYP
jgi:hypothetical protein